MQRLVLFFLLLAAFGTPSLASASASEDARKLYGEGVDFFKQGRFGDAAARFKAAYELDPSPVLLYNLARAAEELGDADQAISHYRAYLELFPQAEDKGEVERRIRVMESVRRTARLGTVVIADVPPDAQVFIDGVMVEEPTAPGQWKHDPGPHQLRVMMADGRIWERLVEIPVAGRVDVSFKQEEAEEQGLSAMAIAGWSSIGGGVLVAGLGGLFFAQAVTAANDFDTYGEKAAQAAAAGDDPSEFLNKRSQAEDDYDQRGTLAYVCFGVGAAAAGTGLALLLLDRQDAPTDAQNPQENPPSAPTISLTPSFGGLSLTGTF